MDEPRAVPEGENVTLGWPGTLIALREQAGCACSVPSPAPAGKYRINVPVYEPESPSAGGGYARTSVYEVTVDFTLPAPGNVVDVALDDSPYLAPCPGPGLCLTRMAPDSPGSGCQLESSPESDCPDYAPKRYRCEKPVPLSPGCVAGLSETEGPSGPSGVVRCCP
jgi:hypothetical protein